MANSMNFVQGTSLTSHGLITLFNNRPTLTVSRQPVSPLDVSTVQAINFISGFIVVIDTSKLTSGARPAFLASGMRDCVLSLSNSGTIGGVQNYVLKAGIPVQFEFDGTNLGGLI